MFHIKMEHFMAGSVHLMMYLH